MTTPLHIVHIIPTLRFGGAERFVVDLVSHADPVRFRFTIITFFNDNPLAAQLPSHVTVRVVNKTNKLGFGLTKKLNQALCELQPDVVHTHLFGADVWGKLAAHQLHLPVVTTEHNINVGESWLKAWVKKSVSKTTDNWLASSAAIANDMRTRYGLKKAVIPVIHYGIDLEKWQKIPAVAYTTASPNLLILGRLVPQKGHEIAIRALAQLQQLPWQLRIVGSGELEAELQRLVARLDLSERVVFAPATSDVTRIMQSTDIELVPSRWEGLGIVIMEAMAAGRLVVAAQTGGIPELITPKTGYLVPEPTVEAWRAQLETILSASLNAQKPIITAGQKYAREHFGLPAMIEAYQNYYQEL